MRIWFLVADKMLMCIYREANRKMALRGYRTGPEI